MSFCQIVVGAPGSGKSTYCNGMQQFMQAIGREAVIVNLDPANEDTQYTCAVDVTDLITVDAVMEELGLGPNGALIYCIDWLDKNLHLLKERLAPFEDKYILFDFPGQAELYTHNTSMRSIADQIKKWDYLPVVVHLLDSHLCMDPANFVAGALMSLSIMCHLELPHVNVLSKIDLVKNHGKLPFRLYFFTEMTDLSYMLQFIDPVLSNTKNILHSKQHEDSDDFLMDEGRYLDQYPNYSDEESNFGSENGSDDYEMVEEIDASGVRVLVNRPRVRDEATSPGHTHDNINEKSDDWLHHKDGRPYSLKEMKKFRKYEAGFRRLNASICDLLTDFSLVAFRPLSITDKYAMHKVLHAVDKGNGYIFAEQDLANVPEIQARVQRVLQGEEPTEDENMTNGAGTGSVVQHNKDRTWN